MKKAKALSPKTNTWRKVMKYTIWTLVIFWTLGSLRGFSLAAKVNSIPQQEKVSPIVKHENFATSEGAQTFAHNFIKEYLTWNKDNYQERADRLLPYLRPGTDEQAGVMFDKITGNSSPEKIELWQVSESGKNQATITFRATHSIKSVVESKDAKGKVTKKEQAAGPFEKWIQVPIITDGTAFMVNGLPTYTSKPPAAAIGALEPTAETETVDAQMKTEITEFLNTFYKQYSTGTIEELEYLTLDENIRPLDSSIIFQTIEKLIVLEKKKEGYVIETEVIFTEKNAQAQVLQNHRLVVSEENGRWQVIKFN